MVTLHTEWEVGKRLGNLKVLLFEKMGKMMVLRGDSVVISEISSKQVMFWGVGED